MIIYIPVPNPPLAFSRHTANGIPSQTPLYVPDHAELTVTMMRCTDNRKVWYQWVVESWGMNNLLGREMMRVRLGGGEVGTSKMGGCMM